MAHTLDRPPAPALTPGRDGGVGEAAAGASGGGGRPGAMRAGRRGSHAGLVAAGFFW